MKFKYKTKKPTRDQLLGMSPSEFKTFLKRRGYKVSRDFYKNGSNGSVSHYKGRAYRYRSDLGNERWIVIEHVGIVDKTDKITTLKLKVFGTRRNLLGLMDDIRMRSNGGGNVNDRKNT